MKRLLIALLLIMTLTFFLTSFAEPVSEKQYYETLLNASLGAKDLDTAQKVVEKALKELKDDPYFLEWGYKIALWNNDRDAATNYALRFYKVTGKYDDRMLELFKYQGIYDVLMEIYEKKIITGNLHDLEAYNYVIENSLEIDRGVNFLKKLYNKTNNPKILKYLVLLLHKAGNSEFTTYAEKYLEYDPEWYLGYSLLSEAYFSKKDFDKSLESLLKYKKLKEEKGAEIEQYILEDISSLAWSLDKKDIAFEASMKIINKGTGRNYDYLIATEYLLDKAPEDALKLALEGFKKFKSDYFAIKYFIVAEKIGWKKDYIEEIQKIEEFQSLIHRNSTLLAFYARGLSKIGNNKKAIYLLEDFLAKDMNIDILNNLIWLLIDTRELEKLEKILKKYNNYALKGSAELKLAFISGYLTLQDTHSAKRLYLSIKDDKNDSSLYLYSFILEVGGETEEGKSIRYNLFEKLKKINLTSLDKEKFSMLLNLYREFDPVEYEKIKSKFKEKIDKKIYMEIYLSHLLNLQEYEKFIYIAKEHRESVKKWMELTVALNEWDKDKQMELLEKNVRELPIRDRVTAAERSAHIGLAKELAFEGLERNRRDYLLYKQFRDLYMNYSNRVMLWSSFLSGKYYSNVNFKFDIRHMITNRLNLNVKSNLATYESKDESVMYNLPSLDKEILTEICYKIENGYLCGGTGYRQALSEFNPFFLRFSYYLKDNMTVFGSGGINLKTDDSVYTLVGGKKDNITFGINYSLTPRSYMTTSYSYDSILSQDNKKIGVSKKIDINAYHKLRIGYPDFTFRLYYQNYSYNEKTGSKGLLDRLTPILSNRFLPTSFWQTGFEFSFGYDNKYTFTRTARPFMTTGMGYNSEGGLIFGISGGWGFTLTKSDNLSSEVSISRQIGIFEETNMGLSILYIKWF